MTIILVFYVNDAGILARLTDSDKEDMTKHQFGYIRWVLLVITASSHSLK